MAYVAASKLQTSDDPVDYSELASTGENFLYSMIHIQGFIWQSMLQYNLEATNFMRHRIEEEMKIAKSMIGCGSLACINDQGLEFCAKALDEYSDEAAKLSQLGKELATSAALEVSAETVSK